jgi:hypothetical protein
VEVLEAENVSLKEQPRIEAGHRSIFQGQDETSADEVRAPGG